MNTDKKQMNTDTQITEKQFLEQDLSYQIRGAVFDVANKYGKGLKEQIYQIKSKT